MYAIVETGGKQYKVSAGQSIDVEKIPAAVGQRFDINNVLLVADGGEVVVGKPTVEGAKVRATVVEQGRRRKITVFKFKSGNRYHRKRGHRQGYTRLRVESILHGGVEEVESVETAAMKEPEAAVAEEAVGRAEVSIEELELSSRVAGALRNGGIRTVEDLMKTDEQELLDIRGFGAKSLEQVRASLKAKGFVKA